MSTLSTDPAIAPLEPPDRLYRLLALAIALLALLVRIGMAWRTHATGEDALITLRYAENLARGQGFVFNPGERTLGTTTPLYTLLLALFAWLHLDAMTLGKACNILADSLTCWLLAHLLARREIGQPVAGLFAALLYALTSTPISVSISGMETGLVTCVGVGMILAYVAQHERALYALGAVLFLLRIDGLLLFGMLAVALALHTRRIPWSALGIGILLILPWLAFSFAYFGSPVPTSLVAKLAVYAHRDAASPTLPNLPAFLTQFTQGWVQKALTLLFLLGLGGVISPQRTQRDTEEDTEKSISRKEYGECKAEEVSHAKTQRRKEEKGAFSFFSLCSSVSSVVKSSPLVVPMLWLVVYYGAMLTSRVPAFGWYFLPPWPLFVAGVALGGAWLVRWAGQWRSAALGRKGGLVWGVALAMVALAGLAHLGAVRRDIAEAQRLEDALRRPMGVWLGEQVGPDERILLEPIGYVGYYSRRRLLDIIGLVSPEVLPSYRTEEPLPDIVQRLHPEWLCLRRREAALLEAARRYHFEQDYRLVQTFAIPGAEPFVIYRRRSPDP
ncbi:MAG TPA: hypothetical protein VKU00_08075 [Chthonomonadaceae bacterium]|nr:hypothetical protein [Chthonomonadaceae bacterium]